MTISILLPSYENVCVDLVKQLQRQAESIDGIDYEIIVADDGGKDMDIKEHNKSINTLPRCHYITRKRNVGRAAIRNFLASQAKGDWLLFIDSDVTITRNDYIKSYLHAIDNAGNNNIAIDGGVEVIGNPTLMRHNLRFWYEHISAPKHTAERRAETPYQHIHTANLLMSRSVFDKYHFDERFIRYGYEDVLFGKDLQKGGVEVLHINAPVGLDKFERNIIFMKKTEEALGTLRFFESELRGYSAIITHSDRLRRLHLRWAMRLWHRFAAPMLKVNLIGKHPSLLCFNIYKLGYYVSLP